MNPRIIDCHQHTPGNGNWDERAEACRKAGIIKAIILGLPPSRYPKDNDEVLRSSTLFPGLFIPYFGVDMDSMKPDDIARAYDKGFKGLKCIAPFRAYNDRAYFPLYTKAAEIKMPIIFHLGIVANTKGFTDCDSNLMRPIHLDHIARNFPELTLVGAHLGNPWCEEAAMSCRWNPNLFYDLSGSLLKYRAPAFLKELLWWRPEGPYAAPDKTYAWQKIFLGSDVESGAIADVVQDYRHLVETLKLPPDLCSALWHDSAAKALGLA